MAFTDLGVTRRKVTQLPSQSWASGTTLTFPLPRVGLLARIYLAIRGSFTSTAASTVNAFGFCSVIRRVRVNINSGIDVFSISGPGYAYLLAPYLDAPITTNGGTPVTAWNGRTAFSVATSPFVLDMVVPIAVNLRDPVGLIMLQNEQTLVTLNVDCETNGNISSGAGTATTAQVIPFVEWFTVPSNTKDWPNLNNIHQIIEDQTPIGAGGLVQYNWPRGNTYLSMIHGTTANTASLSTATFAEAALTTGQVAIRQNQSDYIQSTDIRGSGDAIGVQTNPFLDIMNGLSRGAQRLAGVIPFDLMSTAGLGFYDQMRDVINSALVTDLASVMSFNSTGTLYSVRRQLVPLVAG